MNKSLGAIIQTHIAVILFSFTAILGKLISLSALPLVWWRVLIASLSFLLLFKVRRELKKFSKTQLKWFCFIGILISLHWLTFYGSIKLANASIALICLACTSFITSILEPVINKTAFKVQELLIGILIIPAMLLIINYTSETFSTGIYVGLISAILAALFTILNKKNIKTHDARVVSFIELSSATLFLSLLIPIMVFHSPELNVIPDNKADVLYIIILSIACTTIAFLLSLRSLKHISAFTSTLIINLEPVYGILLASILLKESDSLSLQFYIGSMIILVAVFISPIFKSRNGKNISEKNRKILS